MCVLQTFGRFSMDKPQAIDLTFVEERASARARLLWDKAPATCSAVLACCPSVGLAHHAIYSGSECVQILDQIPRIGPENAMVKVRKGLVAFTWMAAGSSYGV